MEKVRKQKEYADSIRKQILYKPKRQQEAEPSQQGTLVPIVFEKQSVATTRLPKIHPLSVSGGSLAEAALTKHQKVSFVIPIILTWQLS